MTVLIHHAPLWHALRSTHPGGRVVTRCLIGIDYVPVRIATGAIQAELMCPACQRELARDAREEIEIVEDGVTVKPEGTRPLRIRPWTVKRAAALAFVADVHRKLPAVQGAMWCLSARSGSEIVGVALVGWPAQEQTNDEIDTLCVLRVAVKPGNPNACSMLYGACWRSARAMGVDNLCTYTHLDEPGTSLRAAGWIEDGLTEGGELDRPGRRRRKVVDARPKRRWWAPGSKRAPRKEAA